jgi:hypothetical protein
MAGDHFYTASGPERDAAVRDFNYTSEGTAGWVVAPDSQLARPIGIGEHFYTISAIERDFAFANFGYVNEGVSCFVFVSQVPGSVTLHRLLHNSTGDHFYTTSLQERDNAIQTYKYVGEGIACYVFDQQTPESAPLYRLLNRQTGDHFYTTSGVERDNAVANLGFADEGIACYVLTAPQPNAAPLYRLRRISDPGAPVPLFRLLKPTNGDHFYTVSAAEQNSAVSVFGYKAEGIACLVYAKPRAGTVPFFRLLSRQNGDHFYTRARAEADNAIASFGYRDEGIACYVFENQVQGSTPLYRLLQQEPARVIPPQPEQPPARADLALINTWALPTEHPSPGEPVSIWFSFANIGNKASGSFTIRLQDDAGTIVDVSAPSYDPGRGDSVYRNFPNGLPAGSHRVDAYLDIKNQVPESYEGNNMSTHAFGVG